MGGIDLAIVGIGLKANLGIRGTRYKEFEIATHLNAEKIMRESSQDDSGAKNEILFHSKFRGKGYLQGNTNLEVFATLSFFVFSLDS